MCLVDTQMGVASGETLFLHCAFLPLTAVVNFHITATAAHRSELIHDLLFLFFYHIKMLNQTS